MDYIYVAKCFKVTAIAVDFFSLSESWYERWSGRGCLFLRCFGWGHQRDTGLLFLTTTDHFITRFDISIHQ